MAAGNELAQIQEITKGLNAVNTSIQSTNASYLTLVKNIESGNQKIKNTALTFDNLKKAQGETKKTTEDLDKLGKQLATSEEKLKQIEDKRFASLTRKRAEIQKNTKASKDLVRVQNAERGSTEQLSAVNVILEKRLRNVNQTTAKGVRVATNLRSAIDKNNKKITEQSSAFNKQKRGIGGYSAGIQDAASKTGFFSRELTIITKIQATLTVLTQKQTAAQNSSTAATTLGSKALKIFKIALLSTGIGALLIALGSLVAFFKSSEEGAAALQRTLSPFKILFGNLKDLFISFGETLFNAFSNPKEAVINLWEAIKTNIVNRITGLIDTFKFFGKVIKAALDLDFKAVKENAGKAGESIVQALTGVDDAAGKASRAIRGFAEETKKENDQNKQLVNERLALIKRERVANLDIAKLEVEIQKNRLKLKDEENFTNVERLKFAQLAQDQIDEQSKLQDELSAKRLKFKELENSFSVSSQEDLDEEARLRVELVNVQAANAKKLIRIESEKQTIIRKIKADEIAVTKDDFADELDAAIDKANEAVDLEFETNQRLLEESQSFLDEKHEQEVKAVEEAEELEQRKINARQATLQAIKSIFGQETAIGKAATAAQAAEAIRQNLISLGVITAKSAEGQAKSAAALPFPLNIPLILGTIAQFVGIIGLFKKSKTPKFHTGKKGTPGDGFIAGDSPSGGALRELMTLSTGESMLVNTPTYFVGNKFKGATVKTNKETEAIMSRHEQVNNINFDTKELQRENKRGFRRLERAMYIREAKRNKVISQEYREQHL